MAGQSLLKHKVVSVIGGIVLMLLIVIIGVIVFSEALVRSVVEGREARRLGGICELRDRWQLNGDGVTPQFMRSKFDSVMRLSIKSRIWLPLSHWI